VEACGTYNGPFFEPEIGQRYLVSGAMSTTRITDGTNCTRHSMQPVNDAMNKRELAETGAPKK